MHQISLIDIGNCLQDLKCDLKKKMTQSLKGWFHKIQRCKGQPNITAGCRTVQILLSMQLTHWGRVTHICVSKLIIVGSDNGLSPSRCQAIIWTNAGILLIGSLGTNFSEIFIEIYTFSFKKMYLKISSGKWRPFCLGLNVLTEGLKAAFIVLFKSKNSSRSLPHSPIHMRYLVIEHYL